MRDKAIRLRGSLPSTGKGIMPKLKTHSGAAKRFKKTGTGKVKRGHAFARHILTSKNSKRKRQLDQDTIMDKADTKKVKRMIPY
jgi:large subunit ribosomal protein L35